MKASKISDLLPIPEGVKQPHAYQVFGLEAGASEDREIDVAIESTIARMKQHKETAEPKAWRTAARLVRQAESILRDPKKRSELDAQFGIVNLPAEPSGESGKVPFDPLAGVLPDADPLADAPSPESPESITVPPTSAAIPTTPVASPATSSVSARQVAVASPGPEIVAVNRTTRHRRRRSNSGWFLGLMTLGLFAIIAILAYFVFYGPGELAITRTDGALTISTGTADGRSTTSVSTPATARVQEPETTFDPVMPPSPPSGTDDVATAEKSLLRDGEPMEGLPPELQELLDGKPMPPDDARPPGTANEEASTMNDPMTETPMTQAGDQAGDNENPNTMLPVSAATETGESEMTEQMVAAVDQKIVQLQELIRDAKWKEMVANATALKEELMTDQQRDKVDSLYQIADLASYYFGAIERGILSRQAAETITISGALTVAIVEVGPDLLIIRYAGRNKSFKFNELPLNLAHRMAEFTVSQDKSTNVVAKACYQALSPMSNDDQRQESLQWLREINEDVPGISPKKIAEAIERLE